jgi:hypothetical protein
MKYIFISLCIINLIGCKHDIPILPNPEITPGSTNTAVTQDNIQDTICVSGWTKKIRPSSSFTNKLKIQQMHDMGLVGNPKDYEEDHLISLELGGAPRDPKNLWPQYWDGEWGAHKKDIVETRLKKLVCSGQLSLLDAQHDIAVDWVTAYNKYILKHK